MRQSGIIGHLRGTTSPPLSGPESLELNRQRISERISQSSVSDGLKLLHSSLLYQQLPEEIKSYQQILSSDEPQSLLNALPTESVAATAIFTELARQRALGLQRLYADDEPRLASVLATIGLNLAGSRQDIDFSTALLSQKLLAEHPSFKPILGLALAISNPEPALLKVVSGPYKEIVANEQRTFQEALRKF